MPWVMPNQIMPKKIPWLISTIDQCPILAKILFFHIFHYNSHSIQSGRRPMSTKQLNSPIFPHNSFKMYSITKCQSPFQVDDAETEADLMKLLAAVQKDCQICIDKLETSLSTNNLAEAKEQLIVLRYLLSLENSIKERGNRLGIIL